MDNINKAMKLLESLTPGGSEFHNNPQRCHDYVKERMKFQKDKIKKLIIERNNNGHQ
jgi:hypothetical protein